MEAKNIAFLFDSGKIEDSFYGEVIFNYFLSTSELKANSQKMVFSFGDIFNRQISHDIKPFTIRDEVCTIPIKQYNFSGYAYVVFVEDIEVHIACVINQKLFENLSAYIGMTTVDVASVDPRKQFWKNLLRKCSLELNTIISFSTKEQGFGYLEIAENNDFTVRYLEDVVENDAAEDNEDFSLFQQSSQIKSYKQLEIIEIKPDSDRDSVEMSFALAKEVDIAGALIWKAIEDINCTVLVKENEYTITTYIFNSLYQAAQGIERLLKVVTEMIVYTCEDLQEKAKVDELLLSHNHIALYNYIESKRGIKVKPDMRRMLKLLSDFYNKARYHRYSYSKDDVLELTFLREFGAKLNADEFDNKLKHLYGKNLGRLARQFYDLIFNISNELNIYAYELPFDTTANYALSSYYDEDLYEQLKRIELSKKELLCFLIKNH